MFHICFQTPFGQIHLRDARIEDVDCSDDSDDEAENDVFSQYTIAIWPPFQGPTYLMLPSKHEKVQGWIIYAYSNPLWKHKLPGEIILKNTIGQERQNGVNIVFVCFSQDSWLYHLTVAAGGGTGNVGTEYEQLIAKVMEVNGDPSRSFRQIKSLIQVCYVSCKYCMYSNLVQFMF